jgi:hypothetical protein
MFREHLAQAWQAWKEIPREWRRSAVICFFETTYLLLQVWSAIHG